MSHTNNFRLVPLYALRRLGCVMSPHTRDGNLAFLPAILENNLNIKMQRLGWGGLLAHFISLVCEESFHGFKLHFSTETVQKQDCLNRINGILVHKDSRKQCTHCPAFVLWI